MGHAGENVFHGTANDSDSDVDLQHKFQNRSRVWGDMRRLAAVIALMLLPTFAVGQEFSIKGHTLNETTAQFLAVEGHANKHLDKFGNGWIYGRKHSDLTGAFKNGSLVKLNIHLEPRRNEASKLAMTQRMGVPAIEREFPMFNRYGAKWSNYGARWDAVSACATLVIDNSPNNDQNPFLVVKVKNECDADNAKASTNPLD